MVDLTSAQAVAKQAAVGAGDWLKSFQDQATLIKYKSLQDALTTADTKSEELIIKIIEKEFPDHNIFSEEIGKIEKNSAFTWVIDPLDGTNEYIRGHKDFLTLVAFQDEHQVLAGCVYNPCTGEMFEAGVGNGASKNNKPIKVSDKTLMDQCRVMLKLPNFGASDELRKRVLMVLDKLLKQTYRTRSSVYDAWTISLVGQGAYEAFVLLADQGPKWYDLAPALVIAKEAGATITNAKGKPFKHRELSEGLIISNGLIHDQLLGIINQ